MNIYEEAHTTRATSDEGIEQIKTLEGYRSRAYLDSVDKPTIGYGSTRIFGRSVRLGDHITESEALEQLAIDLLEFGSDVNRLVTVYVTQSMYDSLVSFIYNVGTPRFSDSTLLNKLNQKDYEGAAAEFDRWIYGAGKVIPGLANRRQYERAMFERGTIEPRS